MRKPRLTMPGQSLTTLTNWPAVPSGGAFGTFYAMPSGHESWRERANATFLGVPAGSGGVYWTWTDSLYDGTVEFNTTLRINENVPADAKSAVMCRLFGQVLLSHLDQRSLNEACEF